MKDYSAFPNIVTLDIELLSPDEYPGSAYMVFDIDFELVFGSKGKIPVKLTVDGHLYRSTIAVYSGVHMMVFNRTMREETGYKAGDKIKITIERDLEERKVDLPVDVAEALGKAEIGDKFAKLSYSHQKENIAWINDTRNPDTRARRIAKLISVLAEKA